MNIEEVYGFIRSEDAVLWVGTGFSLYPIILLARHLADRLMPIFMTRKRNRSPINGSRIQI